MMEWYSRVERYRDRKARGENVSHIDVNREQPSQAIDDTNFDTITERASEQRVPT